MLCKKNESIEKVIIYGINHEAQQIKILLETEMAANVIAFCVDKEYKRSDILLEIPVLSFEEVIQKYPPTVIKIVLSFGYKNMVKNREEKYNVCKKYGYDIYTYISKDALVYSKEIGEGTIILPGCYLAPLTKVGRGCFLENGVSIAHNTELKDFIFCAPRVNICGDSIINNNCFLGAGCIISGGAKLAERTLVSAGATCLKNTVEGDIVFSNKMCVKNDKQPEDYI